MKRQHRSEGIEMIAGTSKNADPTALTSVPTLAQRYAEVRAFSDTLCKPLAIEDYVIQSMPEVSPTKWHLAHTTWFFETLVLTKALPDYRPFHPRYVYLFNSYYNTIGEPYPRPKRGLLSRPTVEDVRSYRAHVDRHMHDLLNDASPERLAEMGHVIEVGLNHEQQHQELLLTDIQHVFACNPLNPIYREHKPAADGASPLRWLPYPEGLRTMGHKADVFAYDNETPRHRTFVHPFELASRLTTNGEFLAFIDDGAYQRPELWLSDGWATRSAANWSAPLYWEKRDGRWWHMTLAGLRVVEENEPVCHVSYFEADAYARWCGAWLPTEAAWEFAAETVPLEGNFVERGHYHPVPARTDGPPDAPNQMFGDVWEWTCSSYGAYPGFRPPAGALGEYNAKFMCNQFVLRGGSFATSQTHIRKTYRNFFPPDARWQFTGIRLTREV